MLVGVFAEHVFDYCLAFSGSVTSWCRSIARNAAVGGVANSQHLTGLAVDVVYDGAPPGPEATEWLAQRHLLRIPEGDHDHIMAPRGAP